MIEVTNSDRNNCGYFKHAKDFETDMGAKYRRPLVLLAAFALIYNFAGIQVTGSGIGILSGKITNPDIIGYALLIGLLYTLTIYIFALWVRYEDYYLAVTELGKQKKFEQSLVQYLIENKFKSFLRTKNIDVSRVQFHNFDEKGRSHKFELHGVEKSTGKEVADVLNEVGAIHHKDKALGSEYVYTWPYSLSDEDVAFFKRHFRYLNLLHLRNFAEYRMPYMLAVFAIYTFVFF